MYILPLQARAKKLSRRSNLMNKTELIAAMADKSGVTKKDSEASLKAFVEVVTKALKKGDKVQIVGFGTFEVVKRAAREGRNPQTGKSMKIKASKSPKFKAGKALKDALN
jgi:DNA-binding protein HU-beta